MSQAQQLTDGLLPSTTYFCLEGERILGAIRVRHGTNESVENAIGHIGYETRPTARGQGVAQHAIDSPVIVTCSVTNGASQAVIERCGGEFLGLYTDANLGTVRRYRFEP